MDNVLILDKLDELSARFDDKIGQIETNLDKLGQDISNVSHDTELLTGQQKYTLVTQTVAHVPYFMCNSALGSYSVHKGGTNSLIKFKSLMDGTIKLYCKGSSNGYTNSTSGILYDWNTYFKVKNLTTNESIYTNAIYGTSNRDMTFSREDDIVVIKDNIYEMYFEGYSEGRVTVQNITISLLNIYATTEITTKAISKQIVEIN